MKAIGVHTSTDDILNKFNELKSVLPKYDVLILDKYQDINENIASMLEHIKHQSGDNLQIVAVGDMDQKIYNSTRLDVKQFIQEFLGNHEKLTFHTCYRLSAKYAVSCSNGWHKEINGVNINMKWDNLTIDEAVNEIINLEPKDILCLGRRTGGEMFYVLDKVEELCPKKYNKNTVYASIRDEDINNMNPKTIDAIFTTFDSAKGLERPVCFIFDYTKLKDFSTLEDKILYTTYLDTDLNRYLTQVQITISIDTEYFFCYNIKNIKNGVVLICLILQL